MTQVAVTCNGNTYSSIAKMVREETGKTDPDVIQRIRRRICGPAHYTPEAALKFENLSMTERRRVSHLHCGRRRFFR